MVLIDATGLPIADPWQYPAGDEDPSRSEHAVVQLAQWERYRHQFGAPAPGVWVAGDLAPSELRPLLQHVRVIVVEFPKSRDGRGFTLARTLRERHQYGGDIRAAGPMLPDQFAMLIQCGYTSLLASASIPPIRWEEAAMALQQTMARPRTLLHRLSQQA